MLTDMLTEFSKRVLAGLAGADETTRLELHIMVLEARNMEERLRYLTGRPHSPLCGMLIAAPVVEAGDAYV